MRDPKRALLFLQELHRELVDCIMDSGVVFLLDNRSTDWYVFINATFTQQDAALMETLLIEDGERSQYSVHELNTHPTRRRNVKPGKRLN
jgi:hypothetical protein